MIVSVRIHLYATLPNNLIKKVAMISLLLIMPHRIVCIVGLCLTMAADPTPRPPQQKASREEDDQEELSNRDDYEHEPINA
jgi:hypothetical protein